MRQGRVGGRKVAGTIVDERGDGAGPGLRSCRSAFFCGELHGGAMREPGAGRAKTTLAIPATVQLERAASAI
jgi:hypothetical protein